MNPLQSPETLISASSNQAYGEGRHPFLIADPPIQLLSQRAGGSNIPISSSGIAGVPKGTYGFLNGKVLLRSTTAPSSGTLYGSGSVATGTTLMGVGTGANTPGMNGKSPYAGPNFWGSKLPIQNLPVTKSSPSADGTHKQ